MEYRYWRALLALAVGISAASPLASAEPFLLRYDADYTFPEQQGWRRTTYDPDGLLVRELDGTLFTVDSSASVSISDLYWADGSVLDVSAGEQVRIRWRMQTLETDGTEHWQSDVTLTLLDAGLNYAELDLGPGYVSGGYGQGGDPLHVYPFSRGLHDFELRSDLLSYALYVDGVAAFTGTLDGGLPEEGPFQVCFGDTYSGRSSVSQWDYMEAAVVAEPDEVSVLGAVLLVVATGLRRRAA
jgi:hypothetical protein